MFNRENAIGVILLLMCGAAALAILYSIATGTRFQYTGPPWLATALVIFVIGAGIYGFVTRPGRRWPWQRSDPRDPDQPGR